MKKYDVLLTWPTSVDYPLFRKFIIDWGHLFVNRIYIHFNATTLEPDLRQFIKSCFELTDCESVFFEEKLDGGIDWRDSAINNMLNHSNGEYIWFLEQDFFIKEPIHFFETVNKILDEFIAVSFKQTNRWHPACLFTHRKYISQTRSDFGAHPPESDHFGYFSKDLEELGAVVDLEEIGLKNRIDWFHHNGVSSNYMLAEQGEKPNYDIPNFLIYNHASRECEVEQDHRFVELTHKVEDLLTDIKKFI